MAFEKMEKAYDTAQLVEEFKQQGVEVGEETAKILLKVLIPWLKKSFELSETKIDDVVLPLMDGINGYLMALADNINKADNEVAK